MNDELQNEELIVKLKKKLLKAKEAIGVLEDALQEAGDDYPESNMQGWCQQQVNLARAIMAEKD